MPDTPPPVDPDDLPVFEAFRQAGVEERLAYTAVQRVRDVASANLIAQLFSRFDGIQAEFSSVRRELSTLRWLLGLAIAALIGSAVAQFFN